MFYFYFSVNVLKLYFALELKNSTTEPWQKKFAPFNYMLDTAQNVQKDNNVTSVTRPVFELLLKGRIQTNSRFVNAIKTVWNKYSTGQSIFVTVLLCYFITHVFIIIVVDVLYDLVVLSTSWTARYWRYHTMVDVIWTSDMKTLSLQFMFHLPYNLVGQKQRCHVSNVILLTPLRTS